MIDVSNALRRVSLVALLGVMCCALTGQQTFEQLKAKGALRSSYRQHASQRALQAEPVPDLETFRKEIQPILAKACSQCHGPKKQKGDLRVDTLDADLFKGNDVDWWLEVLAVLTNGEMPPEDDVELGDEDRQRVIEWLASEMQVASSVRRATTKHSSFRRMTRYEYNYALQDLLGLPFDFAGDLPPDPTSEDGFQNSSEVLHLSGTQFRASLEVNRAALRLATVVGERPEPIYWSVSMDAAAKKEWAKQDKQLAAITKKHEKDPEKLKAEVERLKKRFAARPRAAYFKNVKTGRMAKQSWGYNAAKHAWQPTSSRPDIAADTESIAIVPPRRTLIVELGDLLPDRGTLRVRVRASRGSMQGPAPSLQLLFGWQASNDSSANFRVSDQELVIDAAPSEPRFYQWDVAMSQVYPRNSMRKTWKLGGLPNPSEYLKLRNATLSGGDIHIDHIEISAPVYDAWPPDSHTRIFSANSNHDNEADAARDVLRTFLSRAWRRDVSEEEYKQKETLFRRLRGQCDSFEEAMLETLASVLASPNFLYVVAAGASDEEGLRLSDQELATRLSLFLWCSTPDSELRGLAKKGQLKRADVLGAQVERMLRDPKAHRLSQQFVRHWLGLELLDFLHVDRKAYPHFDATLKDAMGEEPIAFFHELLQHDHSTLEFLHCSFTMANERLAKHYGLKNVTGNHFRRVEFGPGHRRGGLLTQAGLLAMNSDGLHSHPLKRGVWLLERLLNDPPPPPPPAVPEIDLTDPEIAKMTLKQRIEDHRNHPACMSCHAKIDPWGIAFEGFDAVGSWRTKVQGRPVDSVSFLFNKQKLDGVQGLKRFLLKNRQDQFVRALVYKLTTFALGRPLTFGDRAAIDEITAKTRTRGDGLATMITSIATSELFQLK